MHLHKTGGTTLSKLMEGFYKREEVFDIQGSRHRKSVEELKRLPERTRHQFRVVKGHMFFGLHRAFPQPFVYLALLREPLARALSNYYWVFERPHFHYHEQVVKKRMSFEDYMHAGVLVALDNGMTRMISGCDLDEVPYGRCASEVLARAKENLERHFLVGLTERFDESVGAFARLLGWGKLPAYGRKNVTVKKPAEVEVTDRVLRSIKPYLELDAALYAFAKERYAAQLDALARTE